MWYWRLKRNLQAELPIDLHDHGTGLLLANEPMALI
jgi:hypothetical protein